MRIVQFLVSLRYSVRYLGICELKQTQRPILYLFEHPARHDPLFHAPLLSRLRSFAGRRLAARYVADGDFASHPLTRRLVRLGVAPELYSLPSSDLANAERHGHVEKVLKQIVLDLRSGKNVALSPVGKVLRGDGKTRLDKQYGLASIMQELEKSEIDVIAIKISGLYGSFLSRAVDGELESAKTMRNVIVSFMTGMLIFGVRRKVTVTLERAALPCRANASREAIRDAVESIFHETRSATYVPYNRFDKRTLPALRLN